MADIHTLQVTRFFFCLSITCSAFCYVLDAGALSSGFAPEADIHLSGDASISKDFIQLTMSADNVAMQQSAGWAYSPKIIPLWDYRNLSQAVASFSAYFQFVITRFDNNSGDGLAFFLASPESQFSDAQSGGRLGLFQNNQFVAVEFDTFRNSFDPDSCHVGINVNSVKSLNTFSLKDGLLNNGKKWTAWVDYNGTVAELQVFLAQNPDGTSPSKPESPVLQYHIDLSRYLPPSIKVGISASTGAAIELHALHAWRFSFQYSGHNLNRRPNPAQTPIENLSSSHSILKSIGLIIGIIFTGIVVLIIIFFVWKRRRSTRRGEREETDEELDKRFASAVQSARNFSYDYICAATNNFSADEEIGKGGFGRVYRGTLPCTNQVVAVKRIHTNSAQGKKEYEAEVIVNGNLSHPNVVKLLGWFHKKDDRFLVYEFLHNTSLDKFIFGKPQCRLDWDQRYRIAREIASALFYLHQQCPKSVVHRDIKAGNVMLDSNFTAKLGDFGLARELKAGKEEYTTLPAGTNGYMDPETLRRLKASRESDVYSFGALALAIACGRPPLDKSLTQHNFSLVKWVWHLKAEQRIIDAADNKLDGNFSCGQMEGLILVGLWCCLPDPEDRPKMERVVDVLEMKAELPPLPEALYGDPLTLVVDSWSTENSHESNTGVPSSSSSSSYLLEQVLDL